MKKKAKVECVYVNEKRETFGFAPGQEISPSHPKEINDLPQFEEVKTEPAKETKKKKTKEVD